MIKDSNCFMTKFLISLSLVGKPLAHRSLKILRRNRLDIGEIRFILMMSVLLMIERILKD